jgi:uncharacterized membrane protein YbhN (UPF0104 family)
MSRRSWARVRLSGAVAVLGVLLWRLGVGPFLDGLRETDGWSLVAAALIVATTTVASAWRWTIVARGLGVPVPLRSAVAAYYRSQFLNTMLPGGVLGDVDRGVRHGRRAGSTGLGLRAVAWERGAGQVVQVVLAVVLLLLVPSPLHDSMPLLAGGAVLVAVALVLLARLVPAAVTDLREGLLPLSAWPGIVAASTVATAGHALLFLVAARAAGVTASPWRLLPLALVVLLVMGIPLNLAGWGPREGAAAWAFAAAGLGAGAGVSTAVVYGVMALVSGLPGAAVLVMSGRWHTWASVPTRS